MKRNAYVGAIFLLVLGMLAVVNYLLEQQAAVEAADVMAPRFEVDPVMAEAACRITGCSARPSEFLPMRRIIYGSSIEPARSSPANCTPMRSRQSRNAARRRHRFFHSIRQATWLRIGADRAKGSTGRTPITGSPSTTKGTYGSAATVVVRQPTRPTGHEQ